MYKTKIDIKQYTKFFVKTTVCLRLLRPLTNKVYSLRKVTLFLLLDPLLLTYKTFNDLIPISFFVNYLF